MLKGVCPFCGVGHSAGCTKGYQDAEGNWVLRTQAQPICSHCKKSYNSAHRHDCEKSKAAQVAHEAALGVARTQRELETGIDVGMQLTAEEAIKLARFEGNKP